MTKDSAGSASGGAGMLVLGVDTCGPSGSVALARIGASDVELLGQIELAGRSYSATILAAVGELLGRAGARPGQLAAIAVTSGPGSFTGVRVGLSAVKGLAEPGGIPVVAVSRLAVLARKAGVEEAALDAHRNEIFVRLAGEGANAREILASQADLGTLGILPEHIAVCEDTTEILVRATWVQAEVLRVSAPMAADVVELAATRIRAREFADLALLDGHYLRRSDAEIFGDSAQAARPAC